MPFAVFYGVFLKKGWGAWPNIERPDILALGLNIRSLYIDCSRLYCQYQQSGIHYWLFVMCFSCFLLCCFSMFCDHVFFMQLLTSFYHYIYLLSGAVPLRLKILYLLYNICSFLSRIKYLKKDINAYWQYLILDI